MVDREQEDAEMDFYDEKEESQEPNMEPFSQNEYEAQKWYSDPEARTVHPALVTKDITLSNYKEIDFKIVLLYSDLYHAFEEWATIPRYKELSGTLSLIHRKIMVRSAACRAMGGQERMFTISQFQNIRKDIKSERERSSGGFFNFFKKKPSSNRNY